MLHRLFFISLCLFPLLLNACSGCSSGGNAENIAKELDDRLTEALEFDGGERIDGTPPEGLSDSNAPQIVEVKMGQTLYTGSGIATELQSDFGNPERVEGAIVYVEGAGSYWQISKEMIQKVILLTGRLKEDAEILGKDFTLKFALQASIIGAARLRDDLTARMKANDLLTGAYVPVAVTVSEEKLPDTDEQLSGMTVDGAEVINESPPTGSSGAQAPQISSIEAPREIAPTQSVKVLLRSDFTETVTAAILAVPDGESHMEITGTLENGTLIVTGSFVGRNLQAGDVLTFLWALKSEGGKVGQYRTWIVTVAEEAVHDGDQVQPDGDQDEMVDGDTDLDLEQEPDIEQIVDGDPEEEIPSPIPEFLTVTPGSFWMGSPDGNCPEQYPGSCIDEPGRDTNEELHPVTLTYGFEMMRYELTQAEWRIAAREMGWAENPSWFGPEADGPDCGANCPVERVNWYEALEYANYLSMKAELTPCYVLNECDGIIGGGCEADVDYCDMGTYTCSSATLGPLLSMPQHCPGYRLPTEAEWEYAMRAGSTTPFYPSDGNDGSITFTECELDSNLNQIGWYCGNATETTHPVGSKEANAWGFHDMSGSVFEWMWDPYCSDYENYPLIDPEGSQCEDSDRGMRGGDWYYNAAHCRSADRGSSLPSVRAPGAGFRIARTLGSISVDGDVDFESELDSEFSMPDFVNIPIETFWMGSPAGTCPPGYTGSCTSEPGREPIDAGNETLHEVSMTINFDLQVYETTQAEFTSLMGWNPATFTSCDGAGGGSCPLEGVSWYDALAYANQVSLFDNRTICYSLTNVTCVGGADVGSDYMACQNDTQDGISSADVALNTVAKPQDCEGYRLPTSAEWEIAARAGSYTAIHISEGNDGTLGASNCYESNMAQIAWYCGSANNVTHPVGNIEGNPWGLYDMSGNVWEWIWDLFCLDNSGYGADPDGSSCLDVTNRELRGGSFTDYASYCRSACRGRQPPDYRGIYVGLRLALSVID